MVGNLQAVLDLDRCGVQVVSVRETWLDTGSAVRPLPIAIFGWVAEQERVTIVSGLERSVDRPVRPEVLVRVSPLWHGHAIASGTYHFGGRRAHARA
jgi:hypothetical protein